MPYIGHNPTNAGSFIEVDDFASSFNGSNVAFTLQVGGVDITPNQQNLLVVLDGVLQMSGSAYSVSGSTITFTGAPASGVDLYCVLMGQSASIGQGTIGADELKINGDGTSGQLVKSDGDGTYSYLSTTDITSVGTIATGIWQGTKVASAYLDDDTAHLSSTQTFSGAKTFSSETKFTGNININGSGTRQIKFDDGSESEGAIVFDEITDGFIFKVGGTSGSGKIDAFKIENNGNATFVGEIRANSFLRLYTTDDQANNWYLYTHTDDTFRMNYNGSGGDELTIDTSGNTTFAGNVVINKASNPTYLQIGSSLADDPYMVFQSDGNTFAMGIDRSDSNKFKISDNATLGTNDRLAIDSDGRIAIKASSLPQDFGSERGQLAISSVDNAGANNYAVLQLQGHSVANDVATGGIYFYDHSNNTAVIQTQRDDSTSKGNIYFYTNGGSGVTARAQITSDGYVKHLYQPAFHAYGFSAHILANSGDRDPLKFVNTDLNQGSHYSTTTGRFTAPVDGVYHFYLNTMYRHVDGDFHTFLSVNGTQKTISNNHQEYNASGFAGDGDLHTWVQTSTHLTIALSANDYVTAGFGSSNSSSTYLYYANRYNSFGGHMVA